MGRGELMTNVKVHTPAGPIVAWRSDRSEPWGVRLPGGDLREQPAATGFRVLIASLSGLATERFGGVAEIEAFEELPDGRSRRLPNALN